MEGFCWIVLYFLSNLLLTIHNKWVLSRLDFSFPWVLTAIHIGVSGMGALAALHLFYRQPPKRLSPKQHLKLLSFSTLYAVNIAVSNVSLQHVSLAFHQIIRSATPAFTVAIEGVFLGRLPPLLVAVSLLPVMLGICLTTADEFGRTEFSLEGFWLTVFGVVLSALKGTLTNVLLVGSLKLHPLDLLWKMSLCSAAQCITYAATFGELSRLRNYNMDWNKGCMIAMNGLLAFALNWVSFTANQKTSALSMTVAGNVKQALSIMLAVWVFATPVSPTNWIGIAVTILGGAWYSSLTYSEKQRQQSKFRDNDDACVSMSAYVPIPSQVVL